MIDKVVLGFLPFVDSFVQGASKYMLSNHSSAICWPKVCFGMGLGWVGLRPSKPKSMTITLYTNHYVCSANQILSGDMSNCTVFSFLKWIGGRMYSGGSRMQEFILGPLAEAGYICLYWVDQLATRISSEAISCRT